MEALQSANAALQPNQQYNISIMTGCLNVDIHKNSDWIEDKEYGRKAFLNGLNDSSGACLIKEDKFRVGFTNFITRAIKPSSDCAEIDIKDEHVWGNSYVATNTDYHDDWHDGGFGWWRSHKGYIFQIE